MIAVNPNSICKQAQAYYYDYLCGEPRECIPVEILAHIDKCRFCQSELDRLKIVLAKAEEHAAESTGQSTSAITANLRLHFAYAGALVTCDTVKPFLLGLAIPAMEVRVPTPITVHLDKCQQCANDLEVIRQLNLTHRQLCRLGQLFADDSAEDTVSCSQARAAILAVALTAFHETNAEVLKHLSTCPDCRERLYQFRERVRTELGYDERTQKEFPCEAVSATDIFDYCFPYGIDPANDQYAKFRPALTSHLVSCPTCLAKMQQLHKSVYSIAERPDSEVVTCFTFEEQINEGVEPKPDDLYADWPINVQVLDKSSLKHETSPVIAGLPRTLKQRATKLNLKQFIKPVAAAAAILIVALLLFHSPVAKAVDLGQIREALERIKNACFITFDTDRPEASQEIWISRTLNTKMFKTKTQCVLWDLKGRVHKTRDLNTGSITAAKLDNDVLSKVRDTMEGSLGLLPFNNMPEAPEGAGWQPPANENIETVIPDTKVYDLLWIEKSLDGSAIIHRKWRCYVDIETKLPKRIEWWEKHAKEEEYRLLTTTEVTYPTTIEIRAVIRDAGF